MKNQTYKIVILFFGIFLMGKISFGQYNLSTFYDDQHDINAARLFGSELDLGNHRFQIGIDYYLWLGNNTFNYGSIQNLNSKQSINSDQVTSILSQIKSDNILGFGQDVQVLGLALQFTTPIDKKHFDFTFSIDDKVASNVVLSQDLAKLIWQGNAQFAGQTAKLDPFAINVNYTREYVLGTAFDLFGKDHDGELRLGIRAKYIEGIGAVYMTNKNFTMYTDPEGKYVNVGFDYSINTSRADNSFNLFNPAGYGAGMDFSISYYPTPNFTFAASMTNLNYVTYNKDVVSYSKTGTETYNGAIINNLFGDIQYNPNQITNVFVPQQTNGGSFKIPVSPNLNFLAEYQQIVKDSVKGNFARNSIFLNYIQGFSNEPGTTVNPLVAIGYTHGFGRALNMGLSGTYGGYNRYVCGPFFSVYWSHKRLSFGSDNLGGLLYSHLATGVDMTIHFSVTL